MALRPCLVCGTPARGPRCPAHLLRPQSRVLHGTPYTRLHEKIKRQTVAAWVFRHGWVCPGYRVPPHAVRVGGLEGEHIIPHSLRPDLTYERSNYAVLCRSCNARKGNKIN